MNDFPKLLDPDQNLARELFEQLAEAAQASESARASYSEGEQNAQDILRRAGEFLDLEVHSDAALNLYLTYPGKDRLQPTVVIGGHLDRPPDTRADTRAEDDDAAEDDDDDLEALPLDKNSLRMSGGAIGVVAGIAVFAGFRRLDYKPPSDITIMAMRGGEASWFGAAHIGAFMAFGELPDKALAARRSDSGRSLADHMAAVGCNLEAIRGGEAYLRSDDIKAYIQVAMDPGATLLHDDKPVGLAEAVRGSIRFSKARCFGAAGPIGALPRDERRDAAMATAGLIYHLEQVWRHFEAGHQDLAIAVPHMAVNPKRRYSERIAGQVDFALDLRSTDEQVLHRVARRLSKEVTRLEASHSVRFDMGEAITSEAAAMDPEVREDFGRLAEELRVPTMKMTASGGQEAVVFANFGVPSALLFVRNRAASSNSQAAMAMVDFAKAARLLSAYIVTMLD